MKRFGEPNKGKLDDDEQKLSQFLGALCVITREVEAVNISKNDISIWTEKFGWMG